MAMHREHSQAYYTREQIFNDRFPLSVVAILAIIQMLTTFGIIALEIAHIIINIRLTNLFVGFWTSIPFTILWISMFATVCCCRRRSCATHAVVQNCISFLFASALIGINIAFIRQPNNCFFTEGICNNFSLMNDINLSYECFNGVSIHCQNIRLALIKAQLAAGALIAVTCFIYLIIYTIVASRVSRADRHQVSAAADPAMVPVYQTPLTSVINYQHQPYMNPPHAHQSSAPVMMPAYQSANYVPTIYPQIPNDRF